MNLHDIVTLIFQTIIVVALLFTLVRMERDRATIRQLRATVQRLCGAIVHTVEYVGLDTLPPRPGWSWYDALYEHDRETLEAMLAPYVQHVHDPNEQL